MAGVSNTDLDERRVIVERPLVARAQAELNRWRVRTGIADGAEEIGDRFAIGARTLAGLRDRLAEIHAGRIAVDQRRRVHLFALVPGSGALQRQPRRDPRDQRGLYAPNAEVLAIGAEAQVAGLTRIEKPDLYIVPVLLIQRAVPLQPMIQELHFPAQLVVG